MRLQNFTVQWENSAWNQFYKQPDLTIPFTFAHEALAYSYVGNTKLN